MNYGYAGTRDLNEALTSRFMVINMPEISQENLDKAFKKGISLYEKRLYPAVCRDCSRILKRNAKAES